MDAVIQALQSIAANLSPSNVLLQEKFALYTEGANTTTIIPRDDTIPQNTEGAEFMQVSITPTSATSNLVIEVEAFTSSSADGVTIIGALFQDSGANAIAASAQHMGTATATGPCVIRIKHKMTAGTTASTTFKFRAGANAAATLKFNGGAGDTAGRLFGAITKSSISVREETP